jgi:hypothetical protein
LEDPDVDGRIILKWIFERLVRGHTLDWSVSGKDVLASQEGLCVMELVTHGISRLPWTIILVSQQNKSTSLHKHSHMWQLCDFSGFRRGAVEVSVFLDVA